MSRLKESIEGAFNWAGFSLLAIALIGIAAPILGPVTTAAGGLAILAANVLINTLANPVALPIVATAGLWGAFRGFFKKK